jgi:hypothetical protein
MSMNKNTKVVLVVLILSALIIVLAILFKEAYTTKGVFEAKILDNSALSKVIVPPVVQVMSSVEVIIESTTKAAHTHSVASAPKAAQLHSASKAAQALQKEKKAHELHHVAKRKAKKKAAKKEIMRVLEHDLVLKHVEILRKNKLSVNVSTAECFEVETRTEDGGFFIVEEKYSAEVVCFYH